ncbi:MAG: hypothetical protein PVSMB7_12190 [Chloroflexota bacterium]
MDVHRSIGIDTGTRIAMSTSPARTAAGTSTAVKSREVLGAKRFDKSESIDYDTLS